MSYEGGGLADFPRKEPGVHPACLTSKRAPKYALDHVPPASLKGSLRLVELMYRRYVARQAPSVRALGPSLNLPLINSERSG